MELALVLAGLALTVALSPLVVLGIPAVGVALALRAMDPRYMAYELWDGERTITFVEMVHVGPPAYYEGVRALIAAKGEAGATYLYERVGPGTPEEEARLRAILGYDIGQAAQKEFLGFLARAGSLIVQPHASFMGLTGRPDINADLSVTEILARLTPPKAPVPAPADQGIDRVSGLRAWATRLGFLEDRNPVRRWVARQAVLAAIRLSIVQRHAKPEAPRRDGSVMAAREEHLAATVAATPGDLVVTYGAAHLRPFLRLSPQFRVVRSRSLPLA